METKNSKMFENFIKDSFENHEVAYDAKEWSIFEKKLDKALRNKLLNKIKYASLSTIIIASLVAIYFINNNKVIISDKSTNLNVKKEIIQTQPPIVSENKNPILEKNIETIKPEKLNATIVKNKTDKSVSIINNNQEPLNPIKEKVTKNDKDEKRIIEKEPQSKNNISSANENTNIQNLTIDANKIVACAEEEISFFSSITNKSFEYYWNFGDDNFSTIANPVHTYNESGSFDAKLTVKDIQNGMSYNASLSILVNSKPESKFDYEIVQEGLAYPQVKFLDKSSDALYWEWNFGDEKISYEQNPVHVYFINSDKKINVSLSAMNVNGCKSKVEKTLTFNNIFDIMAPNAFSPDGDGLNDYFIPKALEIYDIPFEMFIYDRAGKLIFNTKTKSNPWNGRNPQTGNQESGTFIWIVILKDNKGNDIKYGGTVSIIK